MTAVCAPPAVPRNDAARCEILETRWNELLAELAADFEDD